MFWFISLPFTAVWPPSTFPDVCSVLSLRFDEVYAFFGEGGVVFTWGVVLFGINSLF